MKIYSPQFELPDAVSVAAVARGDATPDQQRRAFTWIVHGVCQVGRLSYCPESDRDTAFAEGRRSVGLEILLYSSTPKDELTRISERRLKRGEKQ